MSTSPTPQHVGILVLDDGAPGGSAVKQILDSEGWRVRLVPDTQMLLAELKTGEWSLVIANVTLTGVEGPAFVTLQELASVPAAEGGRVRVLFLIPELAGDQYIGQLEANYRAFFSWFALRGKYIPVPNHRLVVVLAGEHDTFSNLQKSFDTATLPADFFDAALQKKKKQASRSNSMFASRDSFSYTDEELAEYEKQEGEISKSKRNKPRVNLGDPNR